MPTIISSLSPSLSPRADLPVGTRTPHYECTHLPRALQLMVFVPGVEAGGLELTTRGPDLLVTARKARPVRLNWSALPLEAVQQDYHLALRLGLGFDFAELVATLRDGVLTILLPKREVTVSSERKVA